MKKHPSPSSPSTEERLVVLKKGQDDGRIYYPSFTARLFAATIDILLSTVLMMPVLPYLAGPMRNPAALELMSKANRGQISEQEFYMELGHVMKTSAMLFNITSSLFAEFLLMGVLVLGFWFYCYSTPGKMIFGMRIVDAKTLENPTRKQLFIRYVGYMVSAVPIGLGFLWMVFNKQRRSWHDMLSGTMVIYKRKPRIAI
jgi:uncharacterized RDD family membrane protein YckC